MLLNVIFNNNYPNDDIHKELPVAVRRSDVVICISRSHVERRQNRSSMNRGRKMDNPSITIQITILIVYAYSCAFKFDRRRKKKNKKSETGSDSSIIFDNLFFFSLLQITFPTNI